MFWAVLWRSFEFVANPSLRLTIHSEHKPNVTFQLYIYIYIYYTCVHIYIYIYIYISIYLSLYLSIYLSISLSLYIYIYIHFFRFSFLFFCFKCIFQIEIHVSGPTTNGTRTLEASSMYTELIIRLITVLRNAAYSMFPVNSTYIYIYIYIYIHTHNIHIMYIHLCRKLEVPSRPTIRQRRPRRDRRSRWVSLLSVLLGFVKGMKHTISLHGIASKVLKTKLTPWNKQYANLTFLTCTTFTHTFSLLWPVFIITYAIWSHQHGPYSCAQVSQASRTIIVFPD